MRKSNKSKGLICTLAAAVLMSASMMGCSNTAAPSEGANNASSGQASGEGTESGAVKEFTAFFSVPGAEINDDNEIQTIIAEKTGAKVKETWLTGQTAEEAIGTLIAGGDYPDFIDGGASSIQLYEADALIPLDDYIEKYPNLKNFLTPQEWDSLRQSDGKIYWIPQFSNIKNEETATVHNDEAFWIQTRVLEWANYPEVRTMDEYFKLIEDYNAANPTMADGTPNIPYTILCEDWRYFCLENAPMFLDGYPNDGVIVDPVSHKVSDYNVTDTAVTYFKKLNEEYKKGIVDPESFTQTYDEYIAKLSTGRVLGMIDQWWNFAYTAGDALKQAKLDEQGCSYVPLPITVNKDVKNQWHNAGGVLNVSGGLAVTTSCKDPDAALKFVNDILSDEIQVLRFWGVEGADYNKDENGLFFRTDEQRDQASSTAYKASHLCTYSYFPQWDGTLDDGKNATKGEAQPSEFFEGLGVDVQKCFDAYKVKTYVEMIGSSPKPGPWYPMWTFTQTMNTNTPGGVANVKMGEVKHEYLPRVVMAEDFDAAWEEYLKVYNEAKPEDYIAEMQAEVDRRIAEAAKYENK